MVINTEDQYGQGVENKRKLNQLKNNIFNYMENYILHPFLLSLEKRKKNLKSELPISFFSVYMTMKLLIPIYNLTGL